MSKFRLFLRHWWPAILIMIAIFRFSSITSKEMPNFGLVDLLVKKGGHALGYGTLALAYLHGLKGKGSNITSHHLLVSWVLATLYSATDEFHQSFVPGRHPSITDVVIDSIGAAVALFLVAKFHNKK